MSLVESTRSIQHVAIAFALILGFSATSESQAPASAHGLAGTWELNIAKSTYEPGPPPYRRSTCKIETMGESVKVTYDMVGIRGGITHIEWTGKLDGKDYAIQGIDEAVTNAYTRIDDRTYDVVVKSDGTKAATARIMIALDGKTLTSIMATRNAQGQTLKTTIIYDRQ